MEPDLHPEEQTLSKFEHLHKVTPFSKYLAMVLFVALPFIGGWVGYTYAPEKVMEVERVVEVEKIVEVEKPSQTQVVTNTKHFLTFNDNSFEISTSTADENEIIYSSDSLMYFYLPWFPKNDWSGKLFTEGTEINNKKYVHLWIQSRKDVPSDDFFREEYFGWHLGEYDTEIGRFKLLMDSSYLVLDDTYENERVLFLSPWSEYPNEAGNIVLSITSCEACGPGPQHYGVLNYDSGDFTLLGRATQIEWVDDSTIRYKTESELGVSKLNPETKEYIDNHYKNCADHPITCYQQINWEQIPWQKVSI